MTDVNVLVRTIAKLEADAKALKAEADEARAELREVLDYGKQTIDEYEVTVSPNRRFNEKKAMTLIESFDDSDYDLVTKDAVNKDALKALYPEVYEKAQDEGIPRITINEAR